MVGSISNLDLMSGCPYACVGDRFCLRGAPFILGRVDDACRRYLCKRGDNVWRCCRGFEGGSVIAEGLEKTEAQRGSGKATEPNMSILTAECSTASPRIRNLHDRDSSRRDGNRGSSRYVVSDCLVIEYALRVFSFFTTV